MEDFLINYGPYAVFLLLMLSGIGLSLNEEIIIITAGMLVAGGQLNFWETLIASYLGVVLSDSLWFYLCFRYGTPLLHKRWFKRLVHPRRLLEAKHQLERRGAWMIVFARFIPASRTTAITVAGLLHMPYWKFLLVTACTTCLTAPLQIGLGVLISRTTGAHEMGIFEQVRIIIGVIVLITAGLLVFNWFRAKRAFAHRPPRAKVRWLRRFHVPRPRVLKKKSDDAGAVKAQARTHT